VSTVAVTLGPGAELEVECVDGHTRECRVCELPMYDRDGDIPRGRLTDIREIPGSPTR